MRYFVFIDTTYYPYGELVDAESPERAVELVRMESNGRGDDWGAFVVEASEGLIMGPLPLTVHDE